MTQLAISPRLLVPLVALALVVVALPLTGRVPLRYNVRNLIVRWPMTLLTAVVFTVVIFLLTGMLAIVNGMAKLTEGSGHPDNVVILADGANDEAFSVLSFTDSSDIDLQPGIMSGAGGKPLCSREVYVIATMPISPKEGRAPVQQTRGKVQRVLVDEGQFLLDEGKGSVRAFRLAEDGKVSANNTEGKLENLKPGDNVWVAFEERGGQPWATDVRGSNRRRFVQVRGVENPQIASEVHRLDLYPGGRWFTDSAVEELPTTAPDQAPETAVQAVVGEGFARALGGDFHKPEGLEVGDVFELGPKKWKVVGIMKSAGTTFSSEVWAKRSFVGELYGKPAVVSSITIRTESPAKASEVAEDLRSNFKKANLQTQTETEYYSQLQGINLQFLAAIIFFTFFMAIGGIFGVMNTMFAAISQRTQDIGVLRLLGYARWQVLASFLLESLVIALVGGLLGCALGSLVHGVTFTSIVGSGQGGFGKTVILKLIVDANTLAVGLILTLVMGLVGGLLPALSAMRLRPLESLR
jgi:putative ABC transport system permease protein